MAFILLLFVVFVGGGWLLGRGIADVLFGSEKKERYDFRTTNVHHHHHEHRHISVIDADTKKKIFELKESKENAKSK